MTFHLFRSGSVNSQAHWLLLILPVRIVQITANVKDSCEIKMALGESN